MTMLLSSQTWHSLSPFLLMVPSPCFPITRYLPMLLFPGLAFRYPNTIRRSYAGTASVTACSWSLKASLSASAAYSMGAKHTITVNLVYFEFHLPLSSLDHDGFHSMRILSIFLHMIKVLCVMAIQLPEYSMVCPDASINYPDPVQWSSQTLKLPYHLGKLVGLVQSSYIPTGYSRLLFRSRQLPAGFGWYPSSVSSPSPPMIVSLTLVSITINFSRGGIVSPMPSPPLLPRLGTGWIYQDRTGFTKAESIKLRGIAPHTCWVIL